MAVEQLYDITNTITSDAVVDAGDSITATADVLNQIGTSYSNAGEIHWYVYSEDLGENLTTDFDLAVSGNNVTVSTASANAGTYKLVAAAENAGTMMYRSAEFTVLEAAVEPSVEITEVNMGDYIGKAWDVLVNAFDDARSYVATFTDGSERKVGEINFEGAEASGGSVAFAIFLHTERANVLLDIAVQ